jgi:hypothetical protein
MKLFAIAVVTAFIMSFGANDVLATVKSTHGEGQTLHETLCDVGLKFRDQVKAVLDQYKGLARANKQLKEAGASYQKSLTADTQNLSRYTTDEQLAGMAGIYTFDAGYAALFLQKKDMGKFLTARKTLNEKIGFTMPLSPKMKALIENPDTIHDFQTWTDALDEGASKFLASGMTTDAHLDMLVDVIYGMMIEGMYIVTESIALADYSPEMLELLNNQHERIDFLIKTLNVFRGDEAFEKAVEFKGRLAFIGEVHNLLLVSQFTQREVDGLRKLIAPERQAILNGETRGLVSK